MASLLVLQVNKLRLLLSCEETQSGSSNVTTSIQSSLTYLNNCSPHGSSSLAILGLDYLSVFNLEGSEVERYPWVIHIPTETQTGFWAKEVRHEIKFLEKNMIESSRYGHWQRLPEKDACISGNKTKSWLMGSHEREGFCSAKKTHIRTKRQSVGKRLCQLSIWLDEYLVYIRTQ